MVIEIAKRERIAHARGIAHARAIDEHNRVIDNFIEHNRAVRNFHEQYGPKPTPYDGGEDVPGGNRRMRPNWHGQKYESNYTQYSLD